MDEETGVEKEGNEETITKKSKENETREEEGEELEEKLRRRKRTSRRDSRNESRALAVCCRRWRALAMDCASRRPIVDGLVSARLQPAHCVLSRGRGIYRHGHARGDDDRCWVGWGLSVRWFSFCSVVFVLSCLSGALCRTELMCCAVLCCAVLCCAVLCMCLALLCCAVLCADGVVFRW